MALSHPVVVILRALGLGDLLTAVPALRAIADAFPDHRRVLVTTPAMVDLGRLTATVDQVIGVAPMAPLPAGLHHPDVAVNLHGRGPESHRVLLAARPGRLIAFADESTGVTGPAWRAGEHEVARWCRLLTESAIPADPGRLHLDPAAVAAPGVAGATVIHPGAASPARRWPASRWAEVAAREAAGGRRVVVTGSPGEVDRCRAVTAAAGLAAGACLAGTTDVVGLAAVVAAAGMVVCGDTGVAHLATAYARPSVVLFGPVPPAEWGPPPADHRHIALWAGSRGDPHGEETDCGLLALTPDQVWAALGRLRTALAGAGSSP